jgi:PadR family transcriptional regulator, regulatory protein PadR
MAWPFRVTDPLLEVVEVLLEADASLYGWAIMKQTQRSGPTVYQVLERLRKAEWVECWWEDEEAPQAPESTTRALAASKRAEPKQPERDNVPRRRYYALSGKGAVQAPRLLAERGHRLPDRRQVKPVPGIVTFTRQLRLFLGGARL